ncbi:hypothetical protein O3M35_010454 [Rhynocoris fuscipes]|uniref:ATP synthase F0 subunit 8 n=1 Tax=Rhynocoris fuscipes TaxID=488301 RepID=A0AAW1D2K6_9HEMI
MVVSTYASRCCWIIISMLYFHIISITFNFIININTLKGTTKRAAKIRWSIITTIATCTESRICFH